MGKKAGFGIFGIFIVFAMAASSFGQTLSQAGQQSVEGRPQIIPGAQVQRMTPQSLRSKLGFPAR